MSSIQNHLTRRRLAACAACAAAALLAWSPAPPARAAEFSSRNIRISIGVTEDHPQSVALRHFAERLAELSGGEMKAKVFPNASLGNDAKSTEGLRAGTLEMNSTSTSPLGQLVPQLGVFDFPFLFNNEKEADVILDGPIGASFEPLFAEKKLVLLCWMENGFRNLTNSVRPITKADDLKGIKLRVMQNSIFLDAFARLGTNPVAMAFSEVYPALESGAIDAQENPNVTILTSKMYEVQKYLAQTRHVYTPFVTLVSQRFWDKLSDDEKGAMRTACHEARDFQRKLTREADAKALEELKAKGMEVTEIAPEERAKMREITQPVVEQHAQQIGADFVKQVYAAIDQVRGGQQAQQQ
jgi:TRAP-type transport system periplasmic protein